VFDIIDAPRKL